MRNLHYRTESAQFLVRIFFFFFKGKLNFNQYAVCNAKLPMRNYQRAACNKKLLMRNFYCALRNADLKKRNFKQCAISNATIPMRNYR